VRRPQRYAAILALLYVVVAGAWIVTSSLWVKETSGSVEEAGRRELWKGLGFVGVTAGLLFCASAPMFLRLSHAHEEQLRNQQVLVVAEHRATAGLMASTVAHDFNNVLTALAGRVDLMRLSLPPGGAWREIEEHLDRMDEACRRGLELSRQLSRMGRESAFGESDDVDVRATVAESLRLIRRHPAVASCTVEFDAAGDPVRLRAYPSLLRQMVINLALNAAEAAGPRGRVRVDVAPAEGGAALVVEDSGPGVPAALQERIFEPLFTTREGGTGLGLVSVRATAGIHGGTVGVEESGLGGARFRVVLRSLPAR